MPTLPRSNIPAPPQYADTIYHNGIPESYSNPLITFYIKQRIINNPEFQRQIKNIEGVTDEIASKIMPNFIYYHTTGKVEVTISIKGKTYPIKLTKELKKAVRKIFKSNYKEKIQKEDSDDKKPPRKTYEEMAEEFINNPTTHSSRNSNLNQNPLTPSLNWDNADLTPLFSSSPAGVDNDSSSSPAGAGKADLTPLFSSSSSPAGADHLSGLLPPNYQPKRKKESLPVFFEKINNAKTKEDLKNVLDEYPQLKLSTIPSKWIDQVKGNLSDGQDRKEVLKEVIQEKAFVQDINATRNEQELQKVLSTYHCTNLSELLKNTIWIDQINGDDRKKALRKFVHHK